MATFISHSSAETEQLGESWGQRAWRGQVVALSGELGSGKTQLVRGFARGLGCSARVHSPTFAIVNVYEGGRLPLVHLDLYRLDTTEQLVAAGVDEFLQPEGVAVIEWAEKLLPEMSGWVARSGSVPVAGQSHGTRSTVQDQDLRNIRFAILEIVDESTRRIIHEDPCA